MDFKRYYFRSGNFNAGVPAQVVGETIDSLRESGPVNAARLVEASRDIEAPLHTCFEWDDNIAAEKHREAQARRLISCVVVKGSEGEKPVTVRAYCSIRPPAEVNEDGVITRVQRQYIPMKEALSDQYAVQQMIEEATTDIKSFCVKYAALAAISPAFETFFMNAHKFIDTYQKEIV